MSFGHSDMADRKLHPRPVAFYRQVWYVWSMTLMTHSIEKVSILVINLSSWWRHSFWSPCLQGHLLTTSISLDIWQKCGWVKYRPCQSNRSRIDPLIIVYTKILGLTNEARALLLAACLCGGLDLYSTVRRSISVTVQYSVAKIWPLFGHSKVPDIFKISFGHSMTFEVTLSEGSSRHRLKRE